MLDSCLLLLGWTAFEFTLSSSGSVAFGGPKLCLWGSRFVEVLDFRLQALRQGVFDEQEISVCALGCEDTEVLDLAFSRSGRLDFEFCI